MNFALCTFGNIRKGFNQKRVSKNFNSLFDLQSNSTIDDIFSGKNPVIIKRDLSINEADFLQKEFFEVGLLTFVMDKNNIALNKDISNEYVLSNTLKSIDFKDLDDVHKGILNLAKDGFNLFKLDWKFWVVTVLITILLTGISSGIPVVGFFLNIQINFLLGGVLVWSAYQAIKGRSLSLDMFQELKPHLLNLLLIGLGATVVTYIVACFSFILPHYLMTGNLVITSTSELLPSLIGVGMFLLLASVVLVPFFLSSVVIIEQNKTADQAFYEGLLLLKSQPSLIGVMLILLIVTLISGTTGFGLLFTLPMAYMIEAFLYERIYAS